MIDRVQEGGLKRTINWNYCKMIIVEPSVELLWITPQPERQIEIAGRTCYKSGNLISDDSAREFARKMRKSGHHAMIEHASASFRIVTDRGISHEIVRHRLASYAQESTRYCNYSKDKFGNQCTFIEPPGLSPEQRQIWLEGCRQAERAYFDLLESGATAQIARAVLPNCLKTELIMTANLREWRHFIKLRAAGSAHPQIRPLAQDIWTILQEYAPAVFEDLDPWQ